MIDKSHFLILILVAIVNQSKEISADIDVVPVSLKSISVQKSHNETPAKPRLTFDKIFDRLLLDIIPPVLGQRSCNENGTYEQFKGYAMDDQSNDDIALASTQEIISRSGYRYENHYVELDDGHSIELIRIINPLVKRKNLRKPPVIFLHGVVSDPRVYIWASALQHHPVRYPRLEIDGPISSWNRSIAFTLSNNGFDVWLSGTRGLNLQNLKFGWPLNNLNQFFKGDQLKQTDALEDEFTQILSGPNSWSSSLDPIIENEMPKLIDKVIEISGSKNATLFAYSQSTATSLSMLGSKPKFAEEKIHSYICMAPIINDDGMNTLIKFISRWVILRMPDEIGNFISSDVILTRSTQNLLLTLSKPKNLRYSLIKFVLFLLFGSSGKYRTLIELPMIAHLFESISFRQIKHFCQFLANKQYQKYDFGQFKNRLIYGTDKPPNYNITNINVKNWLLVSGTNDNLAAPSSVRQVLETVNPKPIRHLIVNGMNHLDLVSAFDNGDHVNLPILRFLEENY